jgi:hypothetical protein
MANEISGVVSGLHQIMPGLNPQNKNRNLNPKQFGSSADPVSKPAEGSVVTDVAEAVL